MWGLFAALSVAMAGPIDPVQDYLDALEGTGFTGVVQVFEGEEVTHTYAAGTQRDGAPIDAESLFYVGSISKHFASVAVLRLVEQGRVDLDQELSHYFEELPAGSWRVGDEGCTVRRVLSHRCGLPRDGKNAGLPALREDDPDSVRAFLTVAGAREPRFTPGSAYEYSNTGFQVAGLLVARLEGKPYEQVLSGLVAPTGLGPITTRPTTAHHYPEQLAQGTVPFFGTWLDSQAWLGVPPDFAQRVGAAGNVLSSASALGPWFRRVARGELLGEAAQQALLEPHLDDYALGLVIEAGPPAAIWHNGALAPAGYASIVAHLPDLDRTVVVLSNQEPPAVSVNDIGFGLLDVLGGKSAELPDRSAGTAASLLTAFLIGVTTFAVPVLLVLAVARSTGARLNWALNFAMWPWSMQLLAQLLGASVGWGFLAVGALAIGLGLWRRRSEPLLDRGWKALGSLAIGAAVVAYMVSMIGGLVAAVGWVVVGVVLTLGMDRVVPVEEPAEG